MYRIVELARTYNIIQCKPFTCRCANYVGVEGQPDEEPVTGEHSDSQKLN